MDTDKRNQQEWEEIGTRMNELKQKIDKQQEINSNQSHQRVKPDHSGSNGSQYQSYHGHRTLQPVHREKNHLNQYNTSYQTNISPVPLSFHKKQPNAIYQQPNATISSNVTIRMKTPIPKMAEDMYIFKWVGGSLGLCLVQDEKCKIPFVKRVTGTGSSPSIHLVHQGDYLIAVNDYNTLDYSMSELMDILRDLPKPIDLTFRSYKKQDEIFLPPLKPDEYDFLWEIGQLGITLANNNNIPYVKQITGKGTSRDLNYVQLGDRVQMVNDRRSDIIGFDGMMQYLKTVPKPCIIRFQKQTDYNHTNTVTLAPTVNTTNLISTSDNDSNQTLSSRSSSHGASLRSTSPSKTSNNNINHTNNIFASTPTRSSSNSSISNNINLLDSITIKDLDIYSITWSDGPFGLTLKEISTNFGSLPIITRKTGKNMCPGLRRVVIGDILVEIGPFKTYELGFLNATKILKSIEKPVVLKFQAIITDDTT